MVLEKRDASRRLTEDELRAPASDSTDGWPRRTALLVSETLPGANRCCEIVIFCKLFTV